MKKLFALFLLFCILISSLIACKSKDIPEETTTKAAASTTEQPGTTAEQPETTKEETEPIKTETIKISNEKHQFTFEKTDFEKNYPEEFLMKVSNFIPMEYGVEDYDNWGGTPNEILNDAYFCRGGWNLDGYEYNSDEWKKAEAEMNKNPYQKQSAEYLITTVDKINSYLRDIYGPESRVFKAEDFDTYNEIKTSDESVFKNYDWMYRFAYLPESELVVGFCRETGCGGGEAIFICDIQNKGDSYVVKAVAGSEDLGENVYTFEGKQGDALRMFNTYTYGKMSSYTFTIGCNDNGDLYMKSVDKSYILPDNAAMNYKVTSGENVKVEVEKYYSSDWDVVDTLSNGKEFYSPGYYYDDDYVSIVTEEYYGRVEKKYVTEIK